MPSKNMIPKGKRRRTVKAEYRAHRDAVREADAAQKVEQERLLFAGSDSAGPMDPLEEAGDEAAATEPVAVTEPAFPLLDDLEPEGGVRSFTADPAARGWRLDAYLAKALPEVSRARVQLLVEHGQVRVNGKMARASLKLQGGEQVEIEGEPQPGPLRAEPEDIPLNIVFEDTDLAVVDKPAGMIVHAGAGDAETNRGTLVNALLFHFRNALSSAGGDLRPGIVHRLDKDTSGLILVAKNDVSHRKLAEMFSDRALNKVYLALVHGSLPKEEGTVDLPVGRDLNRRTRMTTRRSVEGGARPAVSHWRVLERIGSRDQPGPWGAFTLVEVRIETGRTHQIRVHLAALGHPVVGDTLYGAPGRLRKTGGDETLPTLDRNFLHAAHLELMHPRTGRPLSLDAPLSPELESFLAQLRPAPEPVAAKATPTRQSRSRVAKIQAK